jgi:DNA sulfur modification protein DndB
MNMNVTIPSSSVNLVIVEQPSVAASAEAANTGGIALPGVLFKQGTRYCVSTAIPFRQVRTRLQVDHAKEKGNVDDVQRATNRPLMKDHVSSIAQYIKDNMGGRYILPPMTLNAQHTISVYCPSYVAAGDFGSVHFVIPETAKLSVTDGGHRTNAIIRAYEYMNEEQRAQFDRDAISVMITLEGSMPQIHQDFADCSKTKPLPKSQLAAYDRRNPANGLVLDIAEQCKLFEDKIDSTSKTLSALSTNLFLTNQVRQLVKELLVGDYAMSDVPFEDKAQKLLGSSETETYKNTRNKFVEFTNVVTDAIPVLKEIASLPPGLPRNKIKDLRQQGWICLTATGLVIIGRIGYELFKESRADWREIASGLGQADWSRDGGLWQNNIVRAGKMTTQRAPVRVAVEKLRRSMGLPPNQKLDAEVGEQ